MAINFVFTQLGAQLMNKKSTSNPKAWNRSQINPSLASDLYAISHFDAAQTDSTPYGPSSSLDPSEISIEWTESENGRKTLYAGPINIMTLASTNENYMWQVGTDKVSYVDKSNWTRSDSCTDEALANHSESDNSDNHESIDDTQFDSFGQLTPDDLVGATEEDKKKDMDDKLKSFFGNDYSTRIQNGLYPLVSKKEVLYVKYGNFICGYKADNADDPKKICAKYELENPGEKIADDPKLNEAIVGMSMTYDGYLIVVFLSGIGIIDPQLKGSGDGYHCYQAFGDGEEISNSIAVDEDENGNSGIYVASSSQSTGYMRKLVWVREEEKLYFQKDEGENDKGAWAATYQISDSEPPVIKKGLGTGSTPTLMGFGNGSDELVVITDGAQKMNLLAFWRNEIPEYAGGLRLADRIQVKCGLTDKKYRSLDDNLWIQTEQSVVVHEYGAFVVNNIPADDSAENWFYEEEEKNNLILQVSLVGPVYMGPRGVERFEWNPTNHKWEHKWGRHDIPSTSMVPIYSDNGKMVIVSGYNDDNDNDKYWQLVGLSWDDGTLVYKINLSNKNYGNGAYSIPQFLDDNTLIFNSIVGPTRIDLRQAEMRKGNS